MRKLSCQLQNVSLFRRSLSCFLNMCRNTIDAKWKIQTKGHSITKSPAVRRTLQIQTCMFVLISFYPERKYLSIDWAIRLACTPILQGNCLSAKLYHTMFSRPVGVFHCIASYLFSWLSNSWNHIYLERQSPLRIPLTSPLLWVGRLAVVNSAITPPRVEPEGRMLVKL